MSGRGVFIQILIHGIHLIRLIGRFNRRSLQWPIIRFGYRGRAAFDCVCRVDRWAVVVSVRRSSWNRKGFWFLASLVPFSWEWTEKFRNQNSLQRRRRREKKGKFILEQVEDSSPFLVEIQESMFIDFRAPFLRRVAKRFLLLLLLPPVLLT